VRIGENGNVSRVYRLLSLVIKNANTCAIPATLSGIYIPSTVDLKTYYCREFEMKIVAVEILHLQLINFENLCREF
jgi:hypothetical protein